MLDSESPLHLYVRDNFSLSHSFADSVNYKGTYYSNDNHHSVLIHSEDKTRFEVGVIQKIVIANEKEEDQQIIIIYLETTMQHIPSLNLYRVTVGSDFSHITMSELADFYPLYLYPGKTTIKEPHLYISIRTSPYLK